MPSDACDRDNVCVRVDVSRSIATKQRQYTNGGRRTCVAKSKTDDDPDPSFILVLALTQRCHVPTSEFPFKRNVIKMPISLVFLRNQAYAA